jgi:hypothetical protein
MSVISPRSELLWWLLNEWSASHPPSLESVLSKGFGSQPRPAFSVHQREGRSDSCRVLRSCLLDLISWSYGTSLLGSCFLGFCGTFIRLLIFNYYRLYLKWLIWQKYLPSFSFMHFNGSSYATMSPDCLLSWAQATLCTPSWYVGA